MTAGAGAGHQGGHGAPLLIWVHHLQVPPVLSSAESHPSCFLRGLWAAALCLCHRPLQLPLQPRSSPRRLGWL